MKTCYVCGSTHFTETFVDEIKATIEGLDKRVETQEFVNRGIVVGFILAILGGLARLFGLVGNP